MYAGLFAGNGRDEREGSSNPIALLAMMILAPFAAMLIQGGDLAVARVRRRRRRRAIAGNPYGLADALRKIDAVAKQVPMDANPATAHMFIIKPFSGAGLMSLFSTHPSDRGAHPGVARRQPLRHAR